MYTSEPQEGAEVGQVWVRKTDGKRVIISRIVNYGTPMADVYWNAIEGQGHGVVYEHNLLRRYELEERTHD